MLGAADQPPIDESMVAGGDGLALSDGCSCGKWLVGCLVLRVVVVEGTGVKGYFLSIEFLLALYTMLYLGYQYQEYKEEKQMIYFKMYIP